MTLQELNRYYRLIEQLNKACVLLVSLEDSAAPKSPVLNGLPSAQGYGDNVGTLAVEIADMRARVEFLKNEVEQKRREVECYIDSIPEDQVRLIFRLRFLRGLAWGEVAAIIGGGNTENSVKKICYRHLS